MSVYHQMGHQSENLLSEPKLDRYAGAILSPVNFDEPSMCRQVAGYRRNPAAEAIFDPQLYYPHTDLGKIRQWSYFPSAFDTADSASEQWWDNLVMELAEACGRVRPDAVCSPAIVPRTFVDSYFDQMNRVTDRLVDAVAPLGIGVLQSVIVNLADLSDSARVMTIASILTRTQAPRIYLVLKADVVPRREIVDTESLKGAMLLIHTLEQSGLAVLVGYCSSDVILWKTAGATACATGKFWNLRRFTPSRWDPSDQGGGQLPYWFEESLLAAVRESDVIRIERAGLLSDASRHNPFCDDILSRISQPGNQAWIAMGWRQFMYWFSDVEARLAAGTIDGETLLRQADRNWGLFDQLRLFMEERGNDGSWIRPWLRAIVEWQEP